MFKTWRLGSVLGFPIEIKPSFLILLGLVFVAFGGLMGVFIVSLAFASVLLHELGHAVVARKLGVHVSGIELGFLGGAAKMVDMPRRPNHEIAIAAAGPAVSVALALVGLALGAVLKIELISLVGWINLIIAGFNLIPALPMDGGRILRAALAKRMTFVRATDVSVKVARVVAVVFGIFGLMGAYQLLILAPFLWLMGTREQAMARMVEDHYGGYPEGGGPFGVEVLGRNAWQTRGHSGFGGARRGFGGQSGFGFGGLSGFGGRSGLGGFKVSQVGGRLVIEPIE